MIQVFKGVTLSASRTAKRGIIDSETDAQVLSRLRKNEMKELKGWEQ